MFHTPAHKSNTEALRAAAEKHAQYLSAFFVSEDVPAVKAREIAATLRSLAAASGEPTVPWPTVVAYAGGRDAGGVGAWLEVIMGDGRGDVYRYVRATPQAAPAASNDTFDGLTLDQVKANLSLLNADDLRGLVVSLLIQQQIAERAFAIAAWNRRAAPAVPAGWQMVPVEPHMGMCAAGISKLYEASAGDIEATGMEIAEAYRAMLAAAPGAPDAPTVPPDNSS